MKIQTNQKELIQDLASANKKQIISFLCFLVFGTLLYGQGPTLGTYSSAVVSTSQQITISPSSPPTNTNTITANGGPDFSGILSVDPTTGVVSISNAKHEGSYTITVKAFGTGNTTTTFPLTVTSSVCGSGSFSAATGHSLNGLAEEVIIGDLNNDGHQDLISCLLFKKEISVKLGNGNGGFASAIVTTLSGKNPESLAIGDFNGDGNQDIVTGNKHNGDVSFLPGNGAGGFGSPSHISIGNVIDIEVGDFNGDGHLDFITANYTDHTVSVKLGNGSGSFPGTTTVSITNAPWDIEVGDFNGDGNQDFLTTGAFSDYVSIRLGNGSGGFSAAGDVLVSKSPTGITLGDFNEDGNQDFAVACRDGGVDIKLGNGYGSFSGSTTLYVLVPEQIQAGDFNGDGHMDLAVTKFHNTYNIYVFKGNGRGDFSGLSSAFFNDIPITFTVGDFDENGIQDFSTLLQARDSFHISFGQEDNTRPDPSCKDKTVYLDQAGTASIAASDINDNSRDNCGIQSLIVQNPQVDCSSISPVAAWLQVTDASGNTARCVSRITVRDTLPPIAVCKNATVQLDVNGTGFLTSSNLDNGSYDNCSINEFIASQQAFDCSDIAAGPIQVMLEVKDRKRNSSTCTAQVFVKDETPPQALCQPATCYLDANGTASILASDIGSLSSDACGLASITVSPNTLNCSHISASPAQVTLTAVDIYGNAASCFAQVTVLDKRAPQILLQGSDPVHICQGENYVDAGTLVMDNCTSGSAIGNIGIVNTASNGTYIVTYNYTDPSGNAALPVTRTVIVDPTPEAFASQGCSSCGEIRLNICQFAPAPDPTSFVMNNANYDANASLNWYADDNGSKGNPLATAPPVNTNQVSTSFYWVEQKRGDCQGPAIRLRIKVKRLFTPDFNLPAIGCGNSSQIDLAAWVSDPKNKATAYHFYQINPANNPNASPIASVSATNGVVDANQYAVVNVSNGSQTYWVQSIVPNNCGGIASSTLHAPANTASLTPINNLTVNAGDPVNLTFFGQHTTHIFWFNSNNPYIGLLGSFGMGNLSFTAANLGSSPQTATIRVIPYNGNCAGAFQDFSITVMPGSNNRQASGSSLQVTANKLNAHDVLLDWEITTTQDLLRFEIEKKRNGGDFETIGFESWAGNGAYSFVDQSGMGNVNTYRLKLIFADGRKVWSDEVEVKMEYFNNKRFTAFPNPSSDVFHVKALFPLQKPFDWKLYNALGHVVKEGQMEGQEIIISRDQLSAGVYHLTMISQTGKNYLLKLVCL